MLLFSWRFAPTTLLCLSFFLSNASLSYAQGAGCEGLLLSTSEDFTMQQSEGPDGNPIVSDGDLLAFNGGTTTICRRNRDLLQRFDIPRVDFGLDAVAALDREREILAFSTELDDPNEQFGAGDLIFTTGLVIPNSALTQRFDLRHDIGLDAVSLLGRPAGWREFIEKMGNVSRRELQAQPQIVIELLEAFELDILFSTEGTAPTVTAPAFIDGDLLSVRSGTIFRSNQTLLPSLPAGIPSKGVDFGLDAYTFGVDPETGGPSELMSSEIDMRAEGLYTDGDALQPGPTLRFRNEVLLKSLLPASFDLGLDALHLTAGEIACGAPSITRISGVDITDIIGGVAQTPGLSDRPFGGSLRIQGAMPTWLECPILPQYEFRIELNDGSGFPAIGDPNTLAVPTNWRRQLDGNPSPIIDCAPSASNPRQLYQPDGNGWFNLADYRRFDECGEDASLAVWNSSAFAASVEAGDPPVTVQFRLVMREVGSAVPFSVSAVETVRLDNNTYALPASKDMPLTGDVSMTLGVASGSDAQVSDCDVTAGSSDVILDLLGRARDQHFWRYTLRWTGGNVVGWQSIAPNDRDGGGVVQPLDAVFDNDGSDRPQISLGGTVPGNATNVLLSEFNITQAHIAATGGQPPIECGYAAEVTAWDRTIVGSFNAPNNIFGTTTRRVSYPLAFCFQPG
ncbi:hypothetical protein [uncultured Roseobacter sp.]|uniref:hypothetical protein n=1 Tax=uncultured Roseobacter sp. TaxID=114847 RepID=UPI00261D6D10|nr:hypothetical protein [uncultured Roseobacter sp.]